MPDLIQDAMRLIDHGGYVMYPLLALSVLSLALILERSLFWIFLHRRSRLRRLEALNQSLRTGQRAQVQQMLSADDSTYAQVARRLLAHGATDAVAIEAVHAHRPRLERFMVVLSTVITAAPLLGILGTVIGIIQSFQLLGTNPVLVDPKDVAAGIATALVTTAVGLVIALFTLFPYMIFRGQVDRALGRLESVIAAAQQGEQAGSSGQSASNATASRST